MTTNNTFLRDDATFQPIIPIDTPETFGSAGDGVTNDTLTFQAALNSLSPGQALLCRNKYLLGNITVPAGVGIQGDFTAPAQNLTSTWYSQNSQLQLLTGTTITLSQGSSLSNLLIIQNGLSLPVTTNAQCTTLLTQFAGTAITATGVAVFLNQLLILGFTTAVLADEVSSQGWLDMQRVYFDCTNGILYENSGSNGSFYGCRGWPYLTAGVAAASNANLSRGGTAFYFQAAGQGDTGTTLVDCFAFGYNFCFQFVDGINLKLFGCQADGVSIGTFGFEFTSAGGGGSGLNSMIGCRVTSYTNPVYCNSSLGTGQGTLQISDCYFAGSTGIVVEVANGILVATNNLLNQCSTGFKFDAGTGGTLSNNIFSTVTTPITDLTTNNLTAVSNFGYNPVGTTASANVGTSPATITAGHSPETHYVKQSATNTATVTKGSQQILALKDPSTFYVVELGSNEGYVVTWTTTQPTFVRDIH